MTRRDPNIQEHPEAAPPVRKHRNSSGLGTGWEGTGGSETSRVAPGMDGMEGNRSLLDIGEGKTAAEPGVPVAYLLQVQAVDLCQPPELPDARDVLPVQAEGGGGQQPRGSGGTWRGFFGAAQSPPSHQPRRCGVTPHRSRVAMRLSLRVAPGDVSSGAVGIQSEGPGWGCSPPCSLPTPGGAPAMSH